MKTKVKCDLAIVTFQLNFGFAETILWSGCPKTFGKTEGNY